MADRTLSKQDLAYFERRFAVAGYKIQIEDRMTDPQTGLSISGEMYGVKVTHDDGSRFDYRFREEESASGLLERVLDERVSEAKKEVDLHQANLDRAKAHHAGTMKAKHA